MRISSGLANLIYGNVNSLLGIPKTFRVNENQDQMANKFHFSAHSQVFKQCTLGKFL